MMRVGDLDLGVCVVLLIYKIVELEMILERR